MTKKLKPHYLKLFFVDFTSIIVACYFGHVIAKVCIFIMRREIQKIKMYFTDTISSRKFRDTLCLEFKLPPSYYEEIKRSLM